MNLNFSILEDYLKKIKNVCHHSREIGLFRNEPVIKYTEAGSAKEKKDVLVRGFMSVATNSNFKTNNDSKQLGPKTAIHIVEIIKLTDSKTGLT